MAKGWRVRLKGVVRVVGVGHCCGDLGVES